jgi:hypothetical protein
MYNGKGESTTAITRRTKTQNINVQFIPQIQLKEYGLALELYGYYYSTNYLIIKPILSASRANCNASQPKDTTSPHAKQL